ncbi:MAG: hypothetical protein Q3M24_05340 [Candidatus Electrothrix aestuarii]|uniref:Uncharacterized protein n=1 Tax=Candidatus Electrothrix aestuarii TaxID=3062594 RepID=A0AAU8LZ54_9BACT|nr:hypothetical protein [Candidatus Electrothrix aestuarii]
MKTLLTRIQEIFPLPEETIIPFQEAETCYRAGAYRAALLFSYIGWGLALRARLLRSACPAGINSKQWQKNLAKLRREDSWDHEVFDLVQQQKPAPVFLVSEDLRHQVRYWKDRRNDCAHFKTNEIDHSHVESFWQFIFSNLGKFVPNGSTASLQNEIILYFDLNVTPPDTPLDPIIERIPYCVDTDELVKFFEGVVTGISSIFDEDYRINRLVNRVLDTVIRVTNDSTVNALKDFLVTSENCLVNFLREFPQHVILLEQNPQTVRCLWRKHLFSGFSGYHNDMKVFVALLRADLIPQEEKAEANSKAFPYVREDSLSLEDELTLKQNDFFADVFQKIGRLGAGTSIGIVEKNRWVEGNIKIICWYLESHEISVQTVRMMCVLYDQEKRLHELLHEDGSEPEMSAGLYMFFKSNPSKRQEIEKIAQHEKLTLPEAIFGEVDREES